MQDVRQFRVEEQVGLIIAVALHALLAAAFLLQPVREEVFPTPQRMTVSLATEVGLESTAPEPVAESQAAVAPVLSDTPAPVQEPVQAPIAAPVEPQQSQPAPQPTRATPQRPRPQTRPSPRPTRQASNNTPRRRPDARPAPKRPAPRATPTQRSGGSRIGDDFLPGAGSSTTTSETRVPASQIGASAKASIVQAISRQLKPHWDAPSGVDAERLVTILAFELNEDGSLKGRPRVVLQTGDNASNAPQKDIHAERAIAAVRRAAPFDLPSEYYNAWKSIRGARFDRNLSR